MFLLYEELPRNVDLNGVKYELNLAFDSVLYALKAISDPDLTDKDKLEAFLSILIIGKLPSEDVGLIYTIELSTCLLTLVQRRWCQLISMAIR